MHISLCFKHFIEIVKQIFKTLTLCCWICYKCSCARKLFIWCWLLTYGGHHVVWDPFNEGARVLIAQWRDSWFNLICTDVFTSQKTCSCQYFSIDWKVSSVAVEASWVKHLLTNLCFSKLFKLLIINSKQWCLSLHQEVLTWKWHQISWKLSYVTVVLISWESCRRCDVGHTQSNEVVDIFKGWFLYFQVVLSNSVECTVFNCECGLRILDESVKGEDWVVGFCDTVWLDSVGWTWEDWEVEGKFVTVVFRELF